MRSCIAIFAVALLLAPSAHAALIISTGATRNVTCSGGVCTATATNAVLSVTDIASLIATSPVTVQSGSQAADIIFNAPFSWTSANGLTLSAEITIRINRPVSDSGPASLTLNDDGSSGALSFGDKGAISFLSKSNVLTINKQNYILADSIASLASAVASKPSGFFALAHNYDASVDGAYSSSPVSTTFSGWFEGLGNRILNLAINAPGSDNQHVGLFSFVQGGTISDFGLDHVNVSVGDGDEFVGALAGDASTVINSWAAGTVSAGTSAIVGGLVGDGNMSGSHFSGSVTGGDMAVVGGLGGDGVMVTNCWSAGTVKGANDAQIGGLLGYLAGGVSLSHSSATVHAQDDVSGDVLAGGLVGYSVGEIDSSYSLGTVAVGSVGGQGADQAGGLVGEGSGSETNSYALGSVTGKTGSIVGGFAGRNQQHAYTSYSVGRVRGGKNSTVGGFAGVAYGSYIDAYWDIDTSGQKRGVGQGSFNGTIKGLSTKKLKAGLPIGFDPNVWAQNPKINSGYPYLIANPPAK